MRIPHPPTGLELAQIGAELATEMTCRNPACRNQVRIDHGRGRPARFCCDTCRFETRRERERLLKLWGRIELADRAANRPASKAEIRSLQGHLRWLLEAYLAPPEVEESAAAQDCAIDEPLIPLQVAVENLLNCPNTSDPERLNWEASIREFRSLYPNYRERGERRRRIRIRE